MNRDDEQTIQKLRSAMATQVRGHHLNPDIAAAAAHQLVSYGRKPRRAVRPYAAIAACLVGVLAVAIVYAVLRPNARPDHTAASPAGTACAGAVVTGVLPVWARAGFSEASPVMPYITGKHDEIIAVLFTNPLRSPSAKTRYNKILWVAKDHGTGPLIIHAQLEGTKQHTTRTVPGGPGPSIINLPEPGCWQLTLTWSGHHDTLAVPYAAGTR